MNFAQLHDDLGQRYSLSPSQVYCIRSLMLGKKLQQEEMVEFCKYKMKAPARKRNHAGAYYARILQFLCEAMPLARGDVLQ